MAAESRNRWHHDFFLWTILSQDDPQKFSYSSDVVFFIRNYDVITRAPMLGLKTRCKQLGLKIFVGVVSEMLRSKVFFSSVFPIWLPHPVTLDIIIIISTFYMSICTNGENFVSIRRTVAEKNTKFLCGQTDRQTNKETDPNVIPSPNPSAWVTRRASR